VLDARKTHTMPLSMQAGHTCACTAVRIAGSHRRYAKLQAYCLCMQHAPTLVAGTGDGRPWGLLRRLCMQLLSLFCLQVAPGSILLTYCDKPSLFDHMKAF